VPVQVRPSAPALFKPAVTTAGFFYLQNLSDPFILFWSDEDNAYVAEVPERAGGMADGNTYQEALSNAERVIEEWIETALALGRPIPRPRGRLAYA
jgi:predicted RNase H-like HicB family nuclease